ncbi:HpcH/HpaI aldolase/citrate lyase family protein [Microbacterium sp. NIBRBAC000506063]|uniref:HpcH/HpaI aldolase/citrate lyase family protein n=1 Tax=Microbacterium sp. NIBRBAC000506063 TaxID=2734618 RepID=UPI001BB5CF38|nr:CoA ester lyase [Microbacterium sp. NIBRBAC000506063]QTV80809.1 CoA ester lyase [Microbacterium sp. NIBRBAC000506063]
MSEFALGPSLLFCPADRPERFAKAMERADAVILDLEDAVLPAAKRAARGHLIDAHVDADRVIVRVNPVGTTDFEDDLATLAQTDFRTVMVAKAESAKKLQRALDQRFSVIALCETARGIQNADRIAAVENVVGLMWGAEDLVASLGGTSSRFADGRYRDVARHARSQVLLAAGARGKAAIDSVYVDIDDAEGLLAEVKDAAASGFRAKACIHPGQVAAIREAYRPSAEEIEWAQAVLAAAENEHGVFRFRGSMVDEPVLRHARSVRSRAGL